MKLSDLTDKEMLELAARLLLRVGERTGAGHAQLLTQVRLRLYSHEWNSWRTADSIPDVKPDTRVKCKRAS